MPDDVTYIRSSARLDLPKRQSASPELERVLSHSLRSFQRTAYRFLRNTADAEDAVQDAMLSACKHLDQFRGQSQMSTWLTTIVRNSALMQLRRRPRHAHVSLDDRIGEEPEYSLAQSFPDRGPSPEDQCQDTELNRHLAQLMRRLSPVLRKTFQLRAVEGLSIRETAKILGVPNGTVKAQLARARARLRYLMCRPGTRRNRSTLECLLPK